MQMETEMAPTEYVEERGGGYYVAGSRVSLASVIFGFRDGASPETIRQNFPSLSLAQVYGAIAFYLSHPDESEACLQRLSDKWNELEQGGQQPPEELQKKLAGARARLFAGHR
jgi:uncharacterized protein (DUF433 family)